MSSRAAFSLRPIAPFRLDLTVWALRRRPHNLIDHWNGRIYRRALTLNSCAVEIAVLQSGSEDSPRLEVTLNGPRLASGTKLGVTQLLERLLGLQINLAPFYRVAKADPTLGPLAHRFRGLKPPRFATLFETMVNAIACQQMSLSVGILLLNRLTEKFGLGIETKGEQFTHFHDPRTLETCAQRHFGHSVLVAKKLHH